jgi:hypothetical protein
MRARWSEARLYAVVARGRIRGWRDGVAARRTAPAFASHSRASSSSKQPT